MSWKWFRSNMIRYEDGGNYTGFTCVHNNVRRPGYALCMSCIDWIHQNRDAVMEGIK